jgi:DnaJ-class molecular chaperone
MKLIKTASGKQQLKISRKEWEDIGEKAGWKLTIKAEFKKECPECHGVKFVEKKLKNLGTLDYVDHLISCPSCNGKGYISQEDIDSHNHSMGVGPCPHGNDTKKLAQIDPLQPTDGVQNAPDSQAKFLKKKKKKKKILK